MKIINKKPNHKLIRIGAVGMIISIGLLLSGYVEPPKTKEWIIWELKMNILNGCIK